MLSGGAPAAAAVPVRCGPCVLSSATCQTSWQPLHVRLCYRSDPVRWRQVRGVKTRDRGPLPTGSPQLSAPQTEHFWVPYLFLLLLFFWHQREVPDPSAPPHCMSSIRPEAPVLLRAGLSPVLATSRASGCLCCGSEAGKGEGPPRSRNTPSQRRFPWAARQPLPPSQQPRRTLRFWGQAENKGDFVGKRWLRNGQPRPCVLCPPFPRAHATLRVWPGEMPLPVPRGAEDGVTRPAAQLDSEQHRGPGRGRPIAGLKFPRAAEQPGSPGLL